MKASLLAGRGQDSCPIFISTSHIFNTEPGTEQALGECFLT